MKNNFEDKILKKIKQKNVKPIPRWHFLLKDYSSLSLFVGLIILGALGVGVIVLFLVNTDWDIYKYSGKNIFSYTFSIIPYFWLIFLVILTPLVYLNFRHTPKGYRYRASLIFTGVFISFIILGFIIYASGLSNSVEKKLVEISPLYSSHSEMHLKHMWMYPEGGLLAGLIIEGSEKEITIRDLNGKVWNIDIKNTIWTNGGKNNLQERIKIIGKKVSDDLLIAKEIRSWTGIECNMKYNTMYGISHDEVMKNMYMDQNNGTMK
ncbi:MAG: hypothetical protein QM490_04490 [Candidatus Gracilibacteria bacterium]